MNDCEYFVTEDKTDFIDGGRREALESLLGVKVRLTRESWTTSPGRGIWTRMTSPLRLSPIND